MHKCLAETYSEPILRGNVNSRKMETDRGAPGGSQGIVANENYIFFLERKVPCLPLAGSLSLTLSLSLPLCCDCGLGNMSRYTNKQVHGRVCTVLMFVLECIAVKMNT